MCLVFWVEFICLIEIFIRKVCVPEVWGGGNKQSEPINNTNVWKYLDKKSGLSRKVGSYRPSRFNTSYRIIMATFLETLLCYHGAEKCREFWVLILLYL
jgi:hypothetical protein